MNITVKIPALGFAAYSGTGKTTLLRQLIPALNTHGVRVGVIKHAHHTFELDTPGKDSHTLRSAGAHQILVASRHRSAWVIEKSSHEEPDVNELIRQLQDQPLDLIIVEGFKSARIAKIELYRESLGHQLMAIDDPHFIAVAADGPIGADLRDDIVHLRLNDISMIADFVMRWMHAQSKAA